MHKLTFNILHSRGLEKKDEKEGLLKRFKNIEGKKEEQLKAFKNQGENKYKYILTRQIKRMYLLKINWMLNQQ